MAVLHSALQSAKPHVHVDGAQCPTCEQVIPNERFEEISKRIAFKERERQAQGDARMKTELDAIRAQNQAAVDALKADASVKEAAAVEQGKKIAQTAYEAKLVEAAEATKLAMQR